MNRQLVIRGAAISIAAIAGSVFLASEFLGDKDSLASGAISDAPVEIRGASVISPYGSTTLPDGAAPALQVSALDTSPDKAAAATAQDSFQPELSFAEPAPTVEPILALEQAQSVERSLCDASLSAVPAIDGLIELRLSAPCNPADRVVISHGDLAFSTMLDSAGVYTGYIPALAANARIDVFLSDDTYLQAQTTIADYADYARMIVQWSGAAKIDLHAYHRGAAYGDAGHIHAMNPFDPAMEEAFLVALGDGKGVEPMLAQVYSVPAAQAGTARLELEAAVNAETCGTDLIAFVMPTLGSSTGSVEELRVAMPECGSGDGLVILDLPFGSSTSLTEPLEFTSDQM
ncbi:MAG: hypothetical protein JXQ79_07100 [Rhodobacteraceae bacterium]|nr:hypothetical protein [Paracoccaceae bacterium]